MVPVQLRRDADEKDEVSVEFYWNPGVSGPEILAQVFRKFKKKWNVKSQLAGKEFPVGSDHWNGPVLTE